MDKQIRRLLYMVGLLALLIFASAAVFYFLCRVEQRDVPFLRCLYMVIITISTIGYEDMLDTKSSTLLTLFTIFMILTSMVIVAYTISSFTAFLVEGHLKKYFLSKKHYKRIKKMDRHYIICGVKDIGIFAARELLQTKRPFVVIDDSLQALEELHKEIPSLVYIEGDATDDQILIQAGIEKAQALIACLDNDKENLYLVLAAKERNKNVRIAAKVISPKTQKKLLKAGADYLVSPNMIGGLRIASELIRPRVVTFLDRMLRDKSDQGVRIDEFLIKENSPYIGKTLLELYNQTGILPIAAAAAQHDDFQYNPDPQQPITQGTTLIYIASPDQRLKLESP